MPTKKASLLKIIIRNILRRVENFIFLLKSKISKRQFLMLSAVIVAISCSFAVILLKYFAHSVFLYAHIVNNYLKLPYINSILPIAGILLTVFVIKQFLNGSIEKGSSKILYAVAKKGGIVPKKQMYAQIVTSSLTVGLGGSAGLESPIVITGAAFGSNYAQRYRLTQKDRILLLACGVAAGIGAAFNAPIAGVLFAIEVVLADITISAFIPIMISAATGGLISNIVLKEDVLLSFTEQQSFNYHNIPYYILLGVLAGLVSVFHARNFRRVEHYFNQKNWKIYNKALFGASILAIMIFFFPTLFGEGYESIKTLSSTHPEVILQNTLLDNYKSNEWILLLFVGVTMLIKSFATGLTLGSGGNGGNFAPSLFVGSYLGFFVAKFFDLIGFNNNLPVANFTLVGMAGILSGLFHAPLTAIFLIGEITGGYNLMVPLMIVSSLSFAVSKRFEKHSMDVKALADKGDVFTSDKDKNILLKIDILSLIDKSYQTSLANHNSLEKIVKIFKSSNQKVIPIVNEANVLLGCIEYESVKSILFNPYNIKFTMVNDVISTPKNIVQYDAGIEKIMQTFEENTSDYLLVLQGNKYYGFLSKIDVLESYRTNFKEMIIE
jgi:CIC family chloride channel protein